MSKTCPACSAPVSGRFCSQCGATVAKSAACSECSAALQPGARFCNACGAAVKARSRKESGSAPAPAGGQGGASKAPWIVAAVAVVTLLAVVLVPRFRSEEPATGFAPAMAAPASGPQGIDLASMTPQERADRLFDRIMRTASSGDTAQARSFIPMALDAYAMVPELDADARYHLSVLHLLNDDPTAARARSDEILATHPSHLFGLFTAAQAADRAGNRAEAVSLFQRFLEHYPAEIARELPEYTAHAPALPEMRAEAQAFVQGAR